MPLPANRMEAIVDLLYKDNCGAVIKSGTTDPIKLKRPPHIHRAVSAVGNSKGRNVGALQGGPNEALTLVKEIPDSKREQNLATRLQEVSEFDSLHNMICQVGDRRYPAHSFVQARGAKSLSEQLRFAELQEEQEQEAGQVKEVHPVIFQLIPQLLYTGTCDLFQDGATAASLNTLERQEQQDILKEVPEFDSLHDTSGKDGSRYYLLVDPRPGEAPDYDYSTSVQCTGTGRSTAHSRNVMYNTLHSQHLEDEGVEWYLEVSEFDSLHDMICQVGRRRRTRRKGRTTRSSTLTLMPRGTG